MGNVWVPKQTRVHGLPWKIIGSDVPRFERIIEIATVFNKTLNISEMWKTMEFCKNFNECKIHATNNRNVIDLQVLFYKQPFETHQTHSLNHQSFV